MSEKPWMKFFPTNWRADPALRMCSIAARGLWMEMLCLMHEAKPRGKLIVNGNAVSARQLASLSGIAEADVETLLDELGEAGVYSVDDEGVIISRRMIRETKASEEGRKNGKNGGNPVLLGMDKGSEEEGVNPSCEGEDKGQHKTYWHVASGISETPSVEAKASPRARDLDHLEERLREAAGLEQATSPNLFDLSPIVTLLDQGYDLDRDIIPKLRAAKATGKTPSTWAYYTKAIIEGKAKNDAIPPKAQAPPAENGTTWITEDDPRWSSVASRWQAERGKPLAPRGSRYRPGQGADVPSDWLVPH